MILGPRFMKLRAIAFVCILVATLLSAAALSYELFSRWEVSDPTQNSLVVVMILIDAITVIMLPLLLILKFRVWLDAVRMALLLTAHAGAALGVTVLTPGFRCPEDSTGSNEVCRRASWCILFGAWVIPALLTVYIACLGWAAWLNRGNEGQSPAGNRVLDPEAVTPTHAELPIMAPPPKHKTFSIFSRATSISRYSQPSMRQAPPPVSTLPPMPSPLWRSHETEGKESGTASKHSSSRSSGRLEKRLPAQFF